MNLLQLPLDVLYYIFNYLSLYQLRQLSTTCTFFYQLIQDDLLWQNRIDNELTKQPKFVKGENAFTYYLRIYLGPRKYLHVLRHHLPNRRCLNNRKHYLFYKYTLRRLEYDEYSNRKYIQAFDLPRRQLSYGDYIAGEKSRYDDTTRWINKRKEFVRTAAELGLEVWGQKIIQQILSACGELNFSNSKLSNPFYIAILNQQPHFIPMLLQYSWPMHLNPWISNTNNDYNGALISSLLKCDGGGIELLRYYFMNMNLPIIHQTALKADSEGLQNLLNRNTTSFSDNCPFSALFMAVLGQDMTCLRILMRHGWAPAIKKVKGIDWPINELVLAMITNNLTCFQVILEDSTTTVPLNCIRQCIVFALKHGKTPFINDLLDRQYQGIIQEEIYLLSRRIISHKNVKIAHLIRWAGPLNKELILMLVPLLPYCCQSQSSYSDFGHYNAALSMLTMLQNNNLTVEQIVQQTPFYRLLQFCKAIIEYSDRLDGNSYSIVLNVVVKARPLITLTDPLLQKRYDLVCAEYIRLLISWGADGMVYCRNRKGQTMHQLIMQSQKQCWINTLPCGDQLDDKYQK